MRLLAFPQWDKLTSLLRGMGIREWHPEQGFPTARQMARMVAAEVKAQVETAMQREREKAEKSASRRDVRGVARCSAARPHRARRCGDAGGLRRSRIPHQPWPGRAERTDERHHAGAAAGVAHRLQPFFTASRWRIMPILV